MTPARPSAGWTPARSILVIVAVVAAGYANSLGNAFQYDDRHSIVENPHLRSLGQVPAFFARPEMYSRDPDKAMYRPLVLVSLALNHAWSGYAPWSYHVVNLVLHGLCAVLVWALLQPLVPPPRAVFWAAAFALCPLTTEPVNYLSSRSELLAAAGVLASVWLWRRTAAWAAPASALAFAGALLGKESAIVLPLLLWIDDRTRGGWGRSRLRRGWGHAVVAVAYVLVQAGVTGFLTRAVVTAPVRPLATQWATQAKALVYYLRLLLVPVGQSVDHPFTVASAPQAAVIGGVGLALSLAWLVWRLRRGWPGVGSGLLWAGVTLAPTCLVPLNVLVNEHRLYLPLAGLTWALAAAIETAQGRALSRHLRWAGWAGLALFGLLTMARNRVWHDEASLWRDAARRGPGLVRPLVYLGNDARAQGQAEAAAGYYRQALALEPGNGVVAANLANALQDQGHGEEAAAVLRQVVAAHPDWDEARYNLGGVLQRAGRLAEAREQYRQVGTRSPHYALARNNLGTAWEADGQPDSALALYQQALTAAPGLGDARRNLERLRRQAEGQLEERFAAGPPQAAEALARAWLAVDPDWPRVRFFLAAALFAQQRYSESLRVNQELVDARPHDAEACLQLANVLAALGRREQAAAVYRDLAGRPEAGAYAEMAAARLRAWGQGGTQ